MDQHGYVASSSTLKEGTGNSVWWEVHSLGPWSVQDASKNTANLGSKSDRIAIKPQRNL